MIICKICNKKLKSKKGLFQHIHRTHNISAKEYLIMFDENFPKCPICNDYVNYTNGKKYTKTCCKKTCVTLFRKQTCIDKYGCEASSQSKEIKEKAKQTCLEKYGHKSSAQSKEIQEKAKQTCLEKYGVDNPAKLKEIQEKMKQTNLKKYGVECYTQTDEFKEKAHQTKKKNKSYGKSKTEDNVYIYIKENIDENVKRQVFVNKWNIDFYLPKYDLYVQFDGDYWHGYLNTKEQLSKTQQGRGILKVIKHDKEQNNTIPNLIRIRESEWKKNKKCIIEKCTNKTNHIRGNQSCH